MKESIPYIAEPQYGHPITLNVSNKMMDTTMETLKKVSGSKLATYCSSVQSYADGSLKIDRDPEIF